MTHIFVGKIIIISSDNGLSPAWCQPNVWTNAGLLSIEPLRTYFSENLIKIQQFSLKKMHVKMSSAKWRPSYFGLSVLRCIVDGYPILHGTPAQYCPHSNRLLKRMLRINGSRLFEWTSDNGTCHPDDIHYEYWTGTLTFYQSLKITWLC